MVPVLECPRQVDRLHEPAHESRKISRADRGLPVEHHGIAGIVDKDIARIVEIKMDPSGMVYGSDLCIDH